MKSTTLLKTTPAGSYAIPITKGTRHALWVNNIYLNKVMLHHHVYIIIYTQETLGKPSVSDKNIILTCQTSECIQAPQN